MGCCAGGSGQTIEKPGQVQGQKPKQKDTGTGDESMRNTNATMTQVKTATESVVKNIESEEKKSQEEPNIGLVRSKKFVEKKASVKGDNETSAATASAPASVQTPFAARPSESSERQKTLDKNDSKKTAQQQPALDTAEEIPDDSTQSHQQQFDEMGNNDTNVDTKKQEWFAQLSKNQIEMAYDTEEQIKAVFLAQKAILLSNLQVDDVKTEYFKVDESLETQNVFAEDAGEFGQQWFESNENELPTPDMIQQGIQKFYDQKLKDKYSTLLQQANTSEEKEFIDQLNKGTFGTNFFQSKGVVDCDCELSTQFYLLPDSVFIKEVTKMVDMQIPIFESIRKACQTMDSDIQEMLGPLAYVIFHISQSTEGCKEEGKIVTGRDTDELDANLGEYLASFNLYQGVAMSQNQLNSWINSSFDQTGEGEEMAEEVLVAGPTYAYDDMDVAVETAFSSVSNDADLPVMLMFCFKNFYGFEGLAMSKEYSLHPEKNGFLVIEGVTVYAAGVQKVFSIKYNKYIWVVHILNEA